MTWQSDHSFRSWKQTKAEPSPCLTLSSSKRAGDRGPITVEPVRFEGHLVVTDTACSAGRGQRRELLTAAVVALR